VKKKTIAGVAVVAIVSTTVVIALSPISSGFGPPTASPAQLSEMWGMGDAVLISFVYLGCIGFLAWRASRMRRNEYATLNGSMDGYSDYYSGALLTSLSRSVNR
jgi:hypothetical protein